MTRTIPVSLSVQSYHEHGILAFSDKRLLDTKDMAEYEPSVRHGLHIKLSGLPYLAQN